MSDKNTRVIRYKGFIIICANCGQATATVEARQDGVDFQCRTCGNKLLMRPGEAMKVPIMKPKSTQQSLKTREEKSDFVKEQTDQLELDLEIDDLQRKNVPLDDWANEVLDEFYKRNGMN